MASRWGPARLVAASACFALAIGAGWYRDRVGWTEVMTSERFCGAAPSAIEAWSSSQHARGPDEAASLEQWAARHRDSINAQYGPSCRTPLHFAAELGRDDLAAVLIAAGADVEAQDDYEDRPLHAAAARGRAGVAELLIDRGANVNAAGMESTALGGAAYGGHVEIVRMLLDRGAVVDRRVRGSRLEWDGLPLAMALVIARGNDTDVMNRRRDAARVLLRRGADANARNRAGETLLHRMASEGDAGAVQLLLSFGANASARDVNGLTPLRAAVRQGHAEIVRLLLARGALADVD